MSKISVRILRHLSPKYKHKPLTVDIPMIGTVRDEYSLFSGEFNSGQISCLVGHIGDGAAGLSHTLAGKIHYGQGEITIDGHSVDTNQLSAMGFVPWFDPHSKWRRKTVNDEIIEGFSGDNIHGIKGIEELKEKLILSEIHLNRRLEHLSHPRWRASIAIGLAQSKRIFAFPWMNPAYIENALESWMSRTLKILREFDVWVLIPTSDPGVFKDVAGKIIHVKGLFHSYTEEEIGELTLK